MEKKSQLLAYTHVKAVYQNDSVPGSLPMGYSGLTKALMMKSRYF